MAQRKSSSIRSRSSSVAASTEDSSSETNESSATRRLRTRASELIAQGAIDEGLRLFVDSTPRPGFWDRSAEVFKNMARDNAATLNLQLIDPLPIYPQAEAHSLKLRTLTVTDERSPPSTKTTPSRSRDLFPTPPNPPSPAPRMA
jgi:hypothetical protein